MSPGPSPPGPAPKAFRPQLLHDAASQPFDSLREMIGALDPNSHDTPPEQGSVENYAASWLKATRPAATSPSTTNHPPAIIKQT